MVLFHRSAYIHRNTVAAGDDTLNVRLSGLAASSPPIESAGTKQGRGFPTIFNMFFEPLLA